MANLGKSGSDEMNDSISEDFLFEKFSVSTVVLELLWMFLHIFESELMWPCVSKSERNLDLVSKNADCVVSISLRIKLKQAGFPDLCA